ncbi:DUF2326 domain-containing protein [Peribacillus frigoritolerans]|uniref:DUF2326 domain-containing protein n=1 Tax=Peribacillus frigoritolerans TaxID=450367 RepID=UPI002E1A838D|nr:DUF2326 domain-containing protein [Peribacillus frigoritolerans]MED3845703.1 DUF2326 domain-containing protein [Peribacillus frigoritolerans]
MIIKELIIYSYKTEDLKTYKFNEYGLNIILGERTEEGQETNGVGKTTMVESINYLLGGSCPKDFIGKSALQEKDILLILNLFVNEKTIYLGRLINQPEKGYILSAENLSFDLGNWLSRESDEFKDYINEFIINNKPTEPSFSALREYIIRDEKKGFVDIGLPNRKAVYESMYLAYLFGLPYDFEMEISNNKNEQKALNKKLTLIRSLKKEVEILKLKEKKVVKEIDNIDKSITELKITENLAKNASKYKDYRTKYNKIQNTIFELEHIKKQYEKNINDLENKLKEIKQLNDIKPFYEQLIGYFPDKISKNQEQISDFYDFMVQSRGDYFKYKIKEVEQEISSLLNQLESIEEYVTYYSSTFKSTDIVEDISKINEEKNLLFQELVEIRGKIGIYEEKSDVTADINKIKQKILKQIEMKQDIFKNYKDDIESIKQIFNMLVNEAYDEIGILEFELNNNTGVKDTTGRIKIACKINDEKSHGRHYMKVNMFDLSWLIFRVQKGMEKLTFLIHDGSYSKPDKYAKAKLLKIVNGILQVMKSGQYFITLNVDELSDEVLKDFEKDGLIIAKLKRSKNNSDRFFGFRYTP